MIKNVVLIMLCITLGCGTRPGTQMDCRSSESDAITHHLKYGPTSKSLSFKTDNDLDYYEIFLGYKVPLPKNDFIILYSSSRGISMPVILVNLTDGMITKHERIGDQTNSKSLALLENDLYEMKAFITSEFLSGISLRNEKSTRGGKVMIVCARMDEDIYEIYHELPDQPEMVKLIAQYHRLINMINNDSGN